MADVNYVIEIDDSDALKALNQMKKGFNDVETSAKKAQAGVNGVFEDKNGRLREANGRYVKLKDTIGGVSDQFKKASSSGLSFWKLVGGSAVGNLASQALTRLASGIANTGKSALKAAGEYEKYLVTFEAFLGSAVQAQRAMDVLQEFSNNSLFSQEDILSAGKRLLALNIPIDELGNKLKAFGDISAGTGRAIDELVTIYAKVQNQGRVQGDEMLQIAEAGIPIYDVLIKQLGISRVELNKMQEAGLITADIFNKAFLSMGEAGGKFFGLVEKQNDTFLGQVSTMQKEFAVLARSLGSEFTPALKEIATGVSEFLKSLDAGTILAYFAPLRDTLLPALEKLFLALVNIVKVLSGTDLSDATKTTNDLNEAFLFLVDTLTFLVDIVREVVTVIGGLAKISGLTLIIKQMKQGFEELGNVIAWVNGLFGTNAEEAQKLALAQAEAKRVMDLLHKTTFEGVQAALDNLKATKDNTKATIVDTKAKDDLKKAIEALNNAYEQLRIKVRDSNTAQLEGFELIKAENKNALEDIDKLQKQLEKLAKAAGKTLSQEVKNGLNELRQNVNENTAKEVNNRISQIIGNAIKSSGEIYGEQLKKQQEGIENLKEGINKYYDFLEEDEVRRVGLINKSTDETLTLEEYREREILEIHIRWAKRRLKQLENDTTTEGAALRVSIQTTIDLAENELANFTPKKKDKDNFLVRFLKDQLSISSEEAAAIIAGITSSISYIYNSLSESIAAQTQAEIDRNQKLIDSLNERVEKTKAALDEEYANQAKGSTNLLQLKQTEYDKLKIQQEQATAEADVLRKKQLKQQLNAETLSQASSLVTSSANIIQSFSSAGPFGVALSAVAIAAMFAVFAANRAKAYELANQSAYTGGPMTQFLNGKSDRDGQRAYVVVDENGKSVLNLGGNETIVNASASSKYKAELAAMNKGVYKHRGVGEVAETRALSIGQKQTEIVQMREQMNYDEMKRVFGEVMIGYHEDYKKYNDKKEVFIPVKDGYISKKGLHTKKVRI